MIILSLMFLFVMFVVLLVAGICSQSLPQEDEKKLLEKWESNYLPIGVCSLSFAVVFLVCMYNNPVSFTYVICVAVFLLCMRFVYKKMELTMGRAEKICGIFMLLASLSTALTDSWVIHCCNHIIVLLGMLVFALLGYGKGKEQDFLQWIRCLVLMVCESFVSAFAVFGHMKYWKGENEGTGKTKYVALGLLCGIPLVLIVAVILCSADAIFAQWFEGVFELKWLGNLFLYALMFLVGFLGFYGVAYGGLQTSLRQFPKWEKKFEPVVAITAAVMVLVIYVLFAYVQIRYLFLGGIWSLPKEFTYAEYARQGFFQLLFVSILNYIMVLGVLEFFGESRALKHLMTAISLCTYVMIASSFYRMILYVRIYHLTFLRIVVLYFLVGLAVLFGWLLASIYRKNLHFLRNTVITIAAFYLVFAFARPDYLVAYYNSAVNETLTQEDWCNMAEELSLDAAPVLLAHQPSEFMEMESKAGEEKRENVYDEDEYQRYDNDIAYNSKEYYAAVFKEYKEAIEEKQKKLSVRKFNLSVYRAGKALEKSE